MKSRTIRPTSRSGRRRVGDDKPERPLGGSRTWAERRTRHLMREAAALQAALIEGAFDAVLICAASGAIVAANPAAATFFGSSAKTVVGRELPDFMFRPDLTTSSTPLDDLAACLVRDEPVHARRADGSVSPVEMTIRMIVSEGDRRFICHVRDPSTSGQDRNLVEQQRQQLHQVEKWAAMSALLAGVAHELNNPLAILVAQSTLLREKAPDADVQRRAERIHAAAQRAGRIVKGFLAMARQKPPIREPVDVNAVVEQALELVGYGLRSAGIIPERLLAPDLPKIEADPDLIGQVFANLIINAQEALFDRPTDRRLTLRSYRVPEGVAVEIEDNGRGVPEDIKDRIFEPYFTTKSAGAGTGIGAGAVPLRSRRPRRFGRILRDERGRAVSRHAARFVVGRLERGSREVPIQPALHPGSR